MAADDANDTPYISEEFRIYEWEYESPNPPVLIIDGPIDVASGCPVRCEALAFGNGTLYAVDEFGGGPAEGIYSIDLGTGTATSVHTFSDTSISIGGLAHQTGTIFFGTNDGMNWPGGLGIVRIDTSGAGSETLEAPYAGGATDVDGCAYDPAGSGTIYLVQDEAAPIERYDLSSGAYLPSPPMSPVTSTSSVFAGATWAPSLTPKSLIGANYCGPAIPNSVGLSAHICAIGSTVASMNDLVLGCSDMPPNEFGYFLNSRIQGCFSPMGTPGKICLSNQIGRHNMQILNSGPAGMFCTMINLTTFPNPGFPGGMGQVVAGDTWNFQCWYRDGMTSNYSEGLQIIFL